MAAHLAGCIAGRTILPIIGVPMDSPHMSGLDSLYSTVMMPPGIPVASVGIGKPGAKNAGYLAVHILALRNPALREKLASYRSSLIEKVENMDASVKPGDDFFHYVNGKWIAEAEIPADKSSYGGFVLLQDEAQEDVKAIIEISAEGEFENGSDEQKVGDFYKSYLDMDERNERGVEPLAPELARIDAIGDYDDLAQRFSAVENLLQRLAGNRED